PGWPAGWRDLPRFLNRLDLYLRDHFWLRPALIHGHALLANFLLRNGDELVFIGAHGHFFLRGEDAIAQSAGRMVRPSWITATADMLAEMRAELAAHGARLLVAVPPNAATIYPEDLPKWARDDGRPTEYDLLYAALAARGVATLDLRPVLRAAKAQGRVYLRHDTHWSPRGALAGYDAIVAAASLPDWRLAPEATLSPPVPLVGGDLARMLGLPHDVADAVPMLALPPGHETQLSDEKGTATFEETRDPSGRPENGPLIVVIGDSFTDYFGRLVNARHARFVWMHHHYCRFDWNLLRALQPAQVWYLPTERQMLCYPGYAPSGLGATSSAAR
ncbi:MAG TPA: hypothetical protein VFN46_03565, partial [Acetobacteraceae bacterium]|nr:hypothetical protein [Acetobacteraceae bacterium]